MTKCFLIIILVFISQKCAYFAASPSDPKKYESLAGAELARDTLKYLRVTELAHAFKGKKGIAAGDTPLVISKKIVSPPELVSETLSSNWQEDWIVQRDGYRVLYHITFMPCPNGGTTIHVKYPPDDLGPEKTH